MQRRNRHVAILYRFKVGLVTGRMFYTMETKPEIAVSTGVGAFDHAAPCIIVKALTDCLDALDRARVHRRKIDVYQRARCERRIEQRGAGAA